jgi:hypothetical protein
MAWLIGLVVGGLVVAVIGLARRVKWLEGWVRALQASLDADHELLLTVTTIAGNLNAIDALERTGFKEAADAIRLGEDTSPEEGDETQ